MIFINRRNNRTFKKVSNNEINPIKAMPIIEIKPINNINIVAKTEKKPEKKEHVKEMLWGEPTWFLFHTLAEKIKEEYFHQLKNRLFNFIKQICNNLPCPDCANHATRYVNGVNFNSIQNKQQLKVFFFNFHNEINKRKKYELFEFTEIDKYKDAITINIVKNFFYHFNKKNYSVKLDISRNQRSILLKNLREWLEENYYCFDE